MRALSAVLFLILAAMDGFAGTAAEDRLRLGRYAGYAVIGSTGMKIPTTLDTVPIAAPNAVDSSSNDLAAYVKFSFGGFHTHEYVTNYYNMRNYDWTSNELYLSTQSSGGNTQLTFSLDIQERGGFIRGEILARSGGRNVRGQIQLRYLDGRNLDDLFPTLPIFPMVTGAYQSQCTRFHTIQLEMNKADPFSRQMLFMPLAAYTIRGRILGQLRDVSLPRDRVVGVLSQDNLEYDVFSGRVHFVETPLGQCTRKHDRIDCGACVFHALEDEQSFLHRLAHRHSDEPMKPLPPSDQPSIHRGTFVRDIDQRTYSGYLHFEGRGIKLPFTIETRVDGSIHPDDPIGQHPIIASPRIHLVEPQNPDEWQRSLEIPVSPFQIPLTGRRISLKDGRGHLLDVIDWTQDEMKGVFYSGSFARVGTFELSAEPLPTKKFPVKFSIPGDFRAKPIYQPEVGFAAQLSIALQWVYRPSGFPSPQSIAGRMTIYSDRLFLSSRNYDASYELSQVQFDLFTGVLAGEFRRGRMRVSMLGILDGKDLWASLANNAIMTELTPQHSLTHYSLDTPHMGFKAELGREAMMLYIKMPSDARLLINGQEMVAQWGMSLREYVIPEIEDKPYQYEIEVHLDPIGQWHTSLQFTKEQAQQGPIVLDMYEHQAPKAKP